jgi:CelD/BcsL family acetyltransferase involved in cellulose biosynthesis
MGELRLRVLTEWREVERYADIWDDLLHAKPQRNWFMSFDRLRLWAKHRLGQRRLHVILFETGGQPAGFLPLVRSARRRLGLTFHTIELVGAKTVELASFPVPVERPEAVGLVFDHLMSLGGDWDVLWLEELDSDDVRTNAIAEEAKRRALAVEKHPISRCPYLPIDRPFEELFEGLFSSKSRNARLRKLRGLQREKDLQIRQWTPETDLERLLDGLTELEKSSWKGEEQIGIFAPEVAEFHRDLIRFYTARGECDIRYIAQGERIVSYRVGFLWDRVYYDFNTAYHPDVAKLSPSNMLLLLALQDLCKMGVERIDFCRGVQRYKLEWATGIRENCLVRVYNRTARGRLLRSLATLKSRLRGSREEHMPPLPIPLKPPLPPPGTPVAEPQGADEGD